MNEATCTMCGGTGFLDLHQLPLEAQAVYGNDGKSRVITVECQPGDVVWCEWWDEAENLKRAVSIVVPNLEPKP